ncbi:glycine-rich domain-containing protein [Klebsiella michiganensis]|uniref:glycine-rich domain-containing protein n=1 Tax=Klebsiella michiganensis TaxID=1134687 RepID=UPI003D99CAA4
MQSSSSPKKISIPFANSGDKQTIPDTSQIGIQDGRASYPDGFPPLTRTPLSAGGVPPYGTDMNGVLYDLSAAARWNAAGAPFKYDSDFSSSIGGYPKGAILSNSAGDGFWQSIVENNTTNPDSGGIGWINALGGRLINTQTFYSSGTYTPTAGTKTVIVEMVGGGGGSDAAPATGSGQVSIVSGGGAGAYAKGRFSIDLSSISVVVGAGGNRGTSGSPTGSTGGTSSFGTLMYAPGGTRGGSAGPANPPFFPQGNVSSSAPSGANIIGSPGAPSTPAYANATQSFLGSPGASSVFGGGGWVPSFGNAAVDGQAYGSGASGTSQGPSSPAVNGGRGKAGIVIIYEYS